MVEVTFLIEDIDYSDRLDSQLPLVFETLSKSITLATVDGIRRSFEKSEAYRRNQSKDES